MKKAAIEIKESSIHRYGVYAVNPIKPGNIIEECPVLILNEWEKSLKNYWFSWNKNNTEKAAIALGYGSLYNHAEDPNAIAEQDYRRNIIVITALKPIAAGEEIFVSYGAGWLADHGIKEIKPVSLKKQNILFVCRALTVIGAIILLKVGLPHLG